MSKPQTELSDQHDGRQRVESTLRAIHDIHAANGEIDFTRQIRSILEIGIRQIGLPVGLVSQLDGDRLSLPYVVGGGDDLPEGTVIRACDSFCGESIERRRRLVIDNADESPFRDHPGNKALGIKAYIGQPIYVDDVVWGTVCFLDTKPRKTRFTEIDLDLFELICQRIQVGIEHESVLTGFKAVLTGTATATGDGFFRSLVTELCRGLKADIAFVSERLDDDAEGARARTLAVWNDGRLEENFEYHTTGTLSERLTPHGITSRPDEIHRLFPSDPRFARLRLRGYAGIGLADQEGRALGSLVALSRRRLDLKTHEEWLIEIFAARAGAELERARADAEQHRLEREMLHAEKLKSLGVLAGGIAHDFNNLLTGIVGNVGLIQMSAAPGSELADRVAQIEIASTRAESLTKQMLAYSGRGAFVVETMDLNTTIQEVSELLETAVAKNVNLRRSLPETALLVEVDATQVRQLLMNLIMNASDAIGGEPGTVSVSTGVVEVSVADLRAYLGGDRMSTGEFVCLEVVDTGTGMDTETQRRMFDPFFTTKAKGTGLGLSAALGIVQGHHGGLQVRSTVGKGTCVRVLFPAVARTTSPMPTSKSRTEWAKIDGTALVVDDEAIVRTVASEVLRRCGMAVILARDGIEAVKMFETHRAEIGVVLVDLSMPRMDGRRAAERIRRIDAAMPVILMSGYDESEATRRSTASSCDAFLQKPFTAASLMEAVRPLVRREEQAPRPRTLSATPERTSR